MFADAFLPNLVVFLIGQVAAIGYLRTGLVRRGLQILIWTWVFADVVLVSRFGYQRTGSWYLAALFGMQLVSVIGAALFAIGRVRRRLESVRSRRDVLFREAFMSYLRDDLDAARIRYERILRADPWDSSTRLGLATVLNRTGRARRARRLLKSVRSLDPAGELAAAVDAEQRRVKQALRRGVALNGRVARSQHRSSRR